MGLTVGSGPFGRKPSGVFNFHYDAPGHVIYWDDSPRRVRVKLGGETIADSHRTKLLHETGILPVHYFPQADVRMDLLRPTDHSTHCPFKGDAAYWSVEAGGRVAENAVWSYPEPLDVAPPLAGYMAFYWHAMDEWWEEDEQVFVHARDPYHRVDALASSRSVRVSLDGEVLAESSRPVVLFETGLPPRFYLPAEDIREEILVASDLHTQCPYKGTASYWSARLSTGSVEENLIWFYPDPLASVAAIVGRLCFFNERVDLEVDGEVWERPETPFSPVPA